MDYGSYWHSVHDIKFGSSCTGGISGVIHLRNGNIYRNGRVTEVGKKIKVGKNKE
jgi:hypothetical protein